MNAPTRQREIHVLRNITHHSRHLTNLDSFTMAESTTAKRPEFHDAQEAGDRPVKKARLSAEPSDKSDNPDVDFDDDEDQHMASTAETKTSDLYLDTVKQVTQLCLARTDDISVDQSSNP